MGRICSGGTWVANKCVFLRNLTDTRSTMVCVHDTGQMTGLRLLTYSSLSLQSSPSSLQSITLPHRIAPSSPVSVATIHPSCHLQPHFGWSPPNSQHVCRQTESCLRAQQAGPSCQDRVRPVSSSREWQRQHTSRRISGSAEQR